MRKLIAIALLFISSHSTGQVFSLSIDSLTNTYLNRLPKGQSKNFNKILQQRKTVGLLKRIDTSSFDILFIEENFCLGDTEAKITERYFSTDPKHPNPFLIDSIVPREMVVNGLRFNPKSLYYYHTYPSGMVYGITDYYYTLDTLINRFLKQKIIQELTYDSTQTWEGISERFFYANKDSLERRKEEQLKSTYQINTMIDKRNKKISISIQFPAIKPKIVYRYLRRTFDW